MVCDVCAQRTRRQSDLCGRSHSPLPHHTSGIQLVSWCRYARSSSEQRSILQLNIKFRQWHRGNNNNAVTNGDNWHRKIMQWFNSQIEFATAAKKGDPQVSVQYPNPKIHYKQHANARSIWCDTRASSSTYIRTQEPIVNKKWDREGGWSL